MLAFHALSACAAAKSCSLGNLEPRLLEADRQNAEAWALVAMLWYQRGDAGRALAAMQGAAHAPTSTWYWTETISMVERSLAAQSTMPYPRRMGSAFGVGASNLPPLDSLKMCKEESASSRAWAEACLTFGRMRTELNETEMARSIGYSMRVQALNSLGDKDEAAEASAELVQVRAERGALGQGPAMAMQMLQWDLVETSPAQLHSYLGAVQQFGEVEGRRAYLRREVPPLLERAGLLERDGARECVAQLFVGTRRATAGQQAQVGDELYITVSRPSRGSANMTVRIGPDGRIAAPFFVGSRKADGTAIPNRDIAAAGKTMVDLQREIVTTLSEYYQSPEVTLTLLAHGSRDELQREFENARKEAAGKRGNSR